MIVFSFFSSLITVSVQAKENDSHMTGLPEITAEELEWQNKHQLKTKKVKLNKLGLERVNAWRKKKGLTELKGPKAEVFPVGSEIEASLGETAETSSIDAVQDTLLPGELPGYVDNSTLKYFPPIRSQGSLPSCGCFSGTYYTMTHMHAFANDIDAKAGDDSTRLSPKWTYNMVNGGTTAGSWYYWAYDIGQKNGVSTWSEFPYDSNYRAWCLNSNTWKNAIYRRFNQTGYISSTHTDEGITQVKQMLANGYILNFPTYIYSWNYKTIGDDPSTEEDNAFVGKNICYWVNGTSGYHAMTVVGYNDAIWVDINNNGSVDAGEKGAFRIANSWGTGWGEAGFAWMAYDALKTESAVSGGPNTGRIAGWYPSRAHWVTARTDYQPALLAEFTLKHLKRNQLRISLGKSTTSDSTPTSTWIPSVLYADGGPYAFDGTTVAREGTFYFDFSDLADSGGGLYRYYLGVYDSVSGDPATLSSYKIIDTLNGVEVANSDMPRTADLEQIYSYVDYDYNDGNIAPVALMTAQPLSGVAPLSVSFDGTQSYDPDGSIISFSWNFGDQSQANGSAAQHVYTDPGTYEAVLTVTDNSGATATARQTVSVEEDPNKVVFVNAIDMSLQSNPAGTMAVAKINIADLHGNPVSQATVTGVWSGLAVGTSVGTTDASGNVSLNSKKTKKDGVITFTVTGVSVLGFTYDAALNKEVSESIQTSEPVNDVPVAQIQASETSGEPPLMVTFSANNSHDPDGVIVNYEWDFGDQNYGTGTAVSHTYYANGSYTAVLTVTDDLGAKGTDNITINIADPNQVIYVAGIEMERVTVPGGEVIEALVTVLDRNDNPVAGAAVSGEWSGPLSGEATGMTNSLGQALLESKKTRSSDPITITITGVSAGGYLYDPSKNIEMEDSI